MFTFMRVELTGRVKDVVTAWTDTVDVVGNLGVATGRESTVFILHELLEAIFAEHLVFLVIGLMLLC